ncbi:MAG TPA: DNA repair protein RecO [Burkholderiaceae bacterium]|nr:DNA repair protein RecO [Burkholderiaceae bacterium]
MNELGDLPPLVRAPRSGIRRRGVEGRVEQQPGFVLHSYPWRETSLIVELLTRDYGRVAVVARGAKRPTSQFRGLLAPFAPLLVSWSGRNDVKSLIRAEWCGGLAPLRGEGLFAAFYVNELIVRLLARADPHEALFASYVEALRALAQGRSDEETALRGFEMDLLREIGWLPALDHAADGAPIEAEAWYRVDAERGLIRIERRVEDAATATVNVRGRTAMAMATRDLAPEEIAAESKAMLRFLIRYHLGSQPLNTRRILQDLKRL